MKNQHDFDNIGRNISRDIGRAVRGVVNPTAIDDLVRSINITASEIKRSVQDATKPGTPYTGTPQNGPYAPPDSSDFPGAAPSPDFTQRTKNAYEQQRAQNRQTYESQREQARQAYEHQRDATREARNRSRTATAQRPYAPPVKIQPHALAQRCLKSYGGSGTAFSVLGGMMTGLSIAGTAILYGFIGLTALACLGFAAIGTVFLACGSSLHRTAKLGIQYLSLTDGSPFISLEKLAAGAQKAKKQVTRDVHKMIRKGLLPGAHIDSQETCLMLDDATYRQYLQTEEGLKQRQTEEANQQQQEKADPEGTERRRVISEGRACITQINEANNAIPGEAISKKLSHLEDITGKIFTYVEDHPNKFSEIRKFMNYYLPTTLKLVNAYRAFEEQAVQPPNVLGAKAEIEAALSTINTAFENLLNELYQDDALDISTDISALKSVLAQDGLTDSDLKRTPPKTEE